MLYVKFYGILYFFETPALGLLGKNLSSEFGLFFRLVFNESYDNS